MSPHALVEWSIGEVKKAVAEATRMDSATSANSSNEEIMSLRIVLAGRELADDVRIADCDIGQQSVLHAIQEYSSI